MKILQTGRSMIEMLGVLAIIGVLSIGGIVLYRRAVNNHQANTILDDANRLAFVIMESGRAFETYDNITGLDFTQTSPYFMNAFTEATSQQFAIMVTNVPRGVCEALLPKAAIEYKVRTLKANTIQEIAQVSPNSTLYTDSTDICNDINDVVLYFGDVSKQCTPAAGKDCTSNADCCHGEFCWFSNDSDCTEAGMGQCKKVSSYNLTSMVVDGETWTHSGTTMNWWSAQNWCQAQGKNPASRADIDCEDNLDSTNCTQSDTFTAIQEKWGIYGFHWLEDYGNSCHAYYVLFKISGVEHDARRYYLYVLCH